MATKTPNPYVKIGAKPEATGEGGDSVFFTIAADEMIECKVLVNVDEIVSVEQCALWNHYNPSPVWVFIGPSDPSHDLGIKSGYRAFLPISFTLDGEKVVRLWSMSKTSHRQIAEIAEMSGSLKGQVLRIKRTGSGMKTQHTIVPIGKRVKITENVPSVETIIDLLGPYSREEIISLIEQRTNEDWSAVVEKVSKATKGAKPKKGTKTAVEKKKVEVVTLDDEDEDEELEEIEEVEEDEADEEEVEEIDLDEEDEDDIV